MANFALPDSNWISEFGIKTVFNSEETGSHTLASMAIRSCGSSSIKKFLMLPGKPSPSPNPEGSGIESDMGTINSASLDGRMMTLVPAASTAFKDAKSKSARADEADRSLPSSINRSTAILSAPGGKITDDPLMEPDDAAMAWA